MFLYFNLGVMTPAWCGREGRRIRWSTLSLAAQEGGGGQLRLQETPPQNTNRSINIWEQRQIFIVVTESTESLLVYSLVSSAVVSITHVLMFNDFNP